MRQEFYVEQQIKGLCTIPKCNEPLCAGSKSHCTVHRDAHRKRQRERMARMRKWWRFSKLCIYCNGKRKAIEVSPGKFLRYCAVCAEAQVDRKCRRRGVPKSPEHCQKIAEGLRGKPKSPEHRAKIAAAMRRKGANDCTLPKDEHNGLMEEE